MESTGRRFDFQTCLGRGGFGEVYKATMVSAGGLATEVAIKLLRSDIGLGDEAIARLRDEGQLLAMLRHPSILRVIDMTELDGRIGLITEYVHGEDLHLAIRHPADPIPVRPLIETVGQVAEALDAAYGKVVGERALHLIHRDIKPSNIRIGAHGEVKLLDFGVAFSADADRQAQTLTNTALGSLAYMAPERFKRTRPGPAADVYALGCCLYEGMVGDRLFGDPTAVEMFARAAVPEDHDAFIAQRFALLPVGIPPAVGVLLGDMLAYDEAARPTARVVAERCEALAEELAGPTLRRWMRGHDPVPPRPLRGSLEGQTLYDGADDPNRFAQPARPIEPDPGSRTFAIGMELEAGAGIPDTVAPPPSGSGRPAPRRRTPGPPRRVPTPPPTPIEDEPGGPPLLLLAGMTFVVACVVGIAALLWWDPRGGRPETVERAVQPLELGVGFEPEERAHGTVSITGDADDVELRSGIDAYGSGRVPAGSYEVYADFGVSMRYVTNLSVLADRTYTLDCTRASGTCTKR